MPGHDIKKLTGSRQLWECWMSSPQEQGGAQPRVALSDELNTETHRHAVRGGKEE